MSFIQRFYKGDHTARGALAGPDLTDCCDGQSSVYDGTLERQAGTVCIACSPLGWLVGWADRWVVRGSASGGSVDYVCQQSEHVVVAGSRRECHVGAACQLLANAPTLYRTGTHK